MVIIMITNHTKGGLIVMKGWNPFGKIDMEAGSFLKASPFNKEYEWGDTKKANKSKKDERTDK